MERQNSRQSLLDELTRRKDSLVSLTISDPSPKNTMYKRHNIRPIQHRGKLCFQIESAKGAQVFHRNVSWEEFLDFFQEECINYRQICGNFVEDTLHFTKNTAPDDSYQLRSESARRMRSLSHNREKQHLLQEGMQIPALVDLGIFTSDFRIRKDKYDKYQQINRFIEMVEQALPKDNRPLRIQDFGCGKSYLTFVLYDYLVVQKKRPVTITGYDLKKDVVKRCNQLAQKYGYQSLQFCCEDVQQVQDSGVDLLICLHACDTATDYALYHAIRSRVAAVLAVPCCQHEISGKIQKSGGDLDLLLNHGLIRERLCALLTDAMRAEILRQCGYEVDVVEFVDISHSPKNMMLRARKKKIPGKPQLDPLLELEERYQFRQTLLHLILEKINLEKTDEKSIIN